LKNKSKINRFLLKIIPKMLTPRQFYLHHITLIQEFKTWSDLISGSDHFSLIWSWSEKISDQIRSGSDQIRFNLIWIRIRKTLVFKTKILKQVKILTTWITILSNWKCVLREYGVDYVPTVTRGDWRRHVNQSDWHVSWVMIDNLSIN
jgi:hypothetical protein